MSIPTNISEKAIWFNKLLDPTDNCKNLRAFCLNIFDCKLEKNQYWALRDMLDPKIRFIYLSNSRQAGKTHTIALFQAIASLFPEFVIPDYAGKGNAYVFAPKKEQAEISFERFSNFVHFNKYNIFSDSIIVDKFDKMAFRNGFEVRAITASRNAEIEGLSCFLLVLDESQAISPYKVRECLTGDTRIPLADGSYSTVKEVVTNKLSVLSPFGEITPTKYFEYDEDTVYEIKLSNGKTLKCNASHNHLAFNRNWRKTKNPTRKLSTIELKVKDRLAFIDSLPYFGKIGNYKEGFILGSLLGDGSFTDCGSPTFIGTPRAIDIINKHITSTFHRISATKQRTTKSKYVNTVNFVGGFPGIKNSNNLTVYLRELNLWNKTGMDKFIPNKQWSKEFLMGLISGLIETDGSICIPRPNSKKDGRIRGSIEFTNKALGIIKPLQDYLLKFGIHCSIKNDHNRRGKGNCYTLTIKSVEDIRRFYYNFKLTSKQSKLITLVNLLKEKRGRNYSKYYNSRLRFVQIKSIKKLNKKEKVYCIQVENPHQWIADGVVTFNSILPMGGGIKHGAKVIQCGVPGLLGSHFHKAYKNKFDPQTNPYGYVHHIYPWQDCPRLDLKYIMNLKNEDPDSFERNYELKWERSNYGYFTTYEEYEACEEDYDVHALYKKAIDNNWPMYWGIDFAKLRDSTVLITVAQNPETGHYYLVGDIIEFQGTEYIDQIGYIKNIYVPGHIKHTCADKSGVGEMPIEVLNDGGILTTGINFSLQSKDKIYKHLRYQIQNKLIHWPKKLPNKEYRKFKQQFLELEIEHKTTGLISVHHNLDDNLARDDYADSLCLAIWSAAEYVEPNISFI